MTGITNRPEGEEERRQAKTQAKKESLLPPPMAGAKNEIPGKNRSDAADDPGRTVETGAGRGTDHIGH
ncbi:MAG: hypothetical protein HYX52_08135 [Chloroflexi bacterium]|nr:hypothetical protein [Chloroflexota bacterium]